MARDKIHIGCSPVDEECAQLGQPGYFERAQRELGAFVSQLRRAFGTEPFGARLKVEWQRHDFGEYGEVVCIYDTTVPAAVSYAYACESDCPEYWDDAARKELGLDNNGKAKEN